mmetsp:Transcript_35081/g.104689  ORF Transcript_35081/g.104689 Transcript_35081/m.104689 type:complete len:158 (-) Transcript_35081:280-753(-)
MNADSSSIIRTVHEQEIEPYHGLRTVCLYHDENDNPEFSQSREKEADGSVKWHVMRDGVLVRFLRACDILSRREVGSKSDYTARIFNSEGGAEEDRLLNADDGIIVSSVPRWAIKFSDAPYSIDQQLLGTFRHPIGIPDDVMPRSWKDIADKEVTEE